MLTFLKQFIFVHRDIQLKENHEGIQKETLEKVVFYHKIFYENF